MNNQITFDPDGGELGRSHIGNIEPLELVVVLPHIAHILQCLYVKGDSILPYYYTFEFRANTRKQIELVMEAFELPTNVQWYEIDGMKLFQLRGPSGGKVTTTICYLITHR